MIPTTILLNRLLLALSPERVDSPIVIRTVLKVTRTPTELSSADNTTTAKHWQRVGNRQLYLRGAIGEWVLAGTISYESSLNLDLELHCDAGSRLPSTTVAKSSVKAAAAAYTSYRAFVFPPKTTPTTLNYDPLDWTLPGASGCCVSEDGVQGWRSLTIKRLDMIPGFALSRVHCRHLRRDPIDRN